MFDLAELEREIRLLENFVADKESEISLEDIEAVLRTLKGVKKEYVLV